MTKTYGNWFSIYKIVIENFIKIKICICKSLEIRRFTLGDAFYWCFLVPLFWWRPLSKKTKPNLLVSLHEEVKIDLNFIYYLLLYLSFSLSKSDPLNANLWTFSSLFYTKFSSLLLFSFSLSLFSSLCFLFIQSLSIDIDISFEYASISFFI